MSTLVGVRTLTRYGEFETAQGHFDIAHKTLEEALGVYQNMSGISPGEVNSARFDLAELERAEGHRSEGEALYRNVVAADRAASPARPLDTAAHLLGYAAFLADDPHAAGAAPAVDLAREGLNLRLANLPDGFWTIDAARGVLAGVLNRLGRRDEARPLARAACAGLRQKLGDQAMDTRRACQDSAPSSVRPE